MKPVPHLVYNGLLFVALAGALWFVAAKRTPGRVCGGGLAICVCALILAPPVARVGGQRIFDVLALLAWTIFVQGPFYLAACALLIRRTHPRSALASLGGALLIAGIGVDAFFIEPYWIEVNHVRIESAKLDEPIRIAILADIQTDRVGAHERRAVELALAEKPDLILLPGDFVQVDAGRRERGQRVRAALRELFLEAGLDAPLGVFAVDGNCDDPSWVKIFEGLPVHTFSESGRVELEKLTIHGLSFRDSFRDTTRIEPSERFEIVLGHAPDFALGEVHADLLVAGHCHGGQVRLPFLGPLITLSNVPRAWAVGTREIRPGTWLSVSRGIGMERAGAPPLRFLCRPEVLIVDLVPAVPDR